MKTKTQIIKETVKYYSEDTKRRAVTNDGCCYLTDDGRMCAVGRCFTKKNSLKHMNDNDSFSLELVNKMKKCYQVNDHNFWTNLQNLHDKDYYWDESGLTKEGKEMAEVLLCVYKD